MSNETSTIDEMGAAVCAPEITVEQMAQLITTWAFHHAKDKTCVEAVLEVINIAIADASKIDSDAAWSDGFDAAEE